MKKLLLLLVFCLWIPQVVLADSGACSSHGGVSCSIGPDYDGSVVCNDGWRESSVLYTSMAMCGGANINHDYSECDKHTTNPNLPKSLAKSKYEACVRNINSGDYEKEWDRIIQESEAGAQAANQRFNDELKRMEEEDRQFEADLRRQREENQRIVDEYLRQAEERKREPSCPPNSTLGNDKLCYCTTGYEVGGSGCVLSQPKRPACGEGFYLHSSGKCLATLQKCQAEFGKEAKIGPNLECLYCPAGYFLNKEWMCEPYKTEAKAAPTKAEAGASIAELIDRFEKRDIAEKLNTEEVVGVSPKSPVLEMIKGWFGKLFR